MTAASWGTVVSLAFLAAVVVTIALWLRSTTRKLRQETVLPQPIGEPAPVERSLPEWTADPTAYMDEFFDIADALEDSDDDFANEIEGLEEQMAPYPEESQ